MASADDKVYMRIIFDGIAEVERVTDGELILSVSAHDIRPTVAEIERGLRMRNKRIRWRHVGFLASAPKRFVFVSET